MAARRTKEIPFTVNRDDSRALLAQVADGLRDAIVSGRYAPGDVVPSSRALAATLGVSHIVTEAALKRLAGEGFIVARPRAGCVVRDRNVKQWRGHVVTVHPQGDIGYFSAFFAEELRPALNHAGYLLSRATVGVPQNGGPCDFSILDAALARSVDLAIVFYNRAAIFRHLAARKVPYVVVAHRQTVPAGAVGLVRFDYEAAAPDFATACRAGGVRTAVILRLSSMMCNAAPALQDAGIAVRTVSVKPDFSLGRFIGAEKAGYDGFMRLAESGMLSPDTALFVSDDYLARGAISAMLAAGLRPPRDFRLAVWSNAGLGPYYPLDLSRMEADPVAAGAATASAALSFLKTGRYSSDTAIRPRWIPGETLAAPPNQPTTTPQENHHETDARHPRVRPRLGGASRRT
jgi:DNA-binding LacI/PurR family transcriptional regulator